MHNAIAAKKCYFTQLSTFETDLMVDKKCLSRKNMNLNRDIFLTQATTSNSNSKWSPIYWFKGN